MFDDTREHWVKNQTKETRVVLIIDFNANMPFPVNLYTGAALQPRPPQRRGAEGHRARLDRRAAAQPGASTDATA